MNKLIEIKIKRFFYPIGQGAFYAEKHQIGDKYFTIVYDCGTCRNCKKGQLKFADTVIEKAFKKDDIIDILFISHFDYDHVSKIAKLKEHTHIKKVVMPLLQEDDIYLLSNIYTALEFNHVVELIKNPKEFFGESTRIIRVDFTEEGEQPLLNITSKHINSLDETIKSGSIFHTKLEYNWIFIPFNHKQKDRISKLEEELIKEKFDINKLKKDTEYILTLIKKDRTKIRKIREIYTRLKGNINENSMLLYSGLPLNNKKYLKKKSYLFDFKNKICWHGVANTTNRIGCIFTGDTDLTRVRIEHIFMNWWDMVGTIQIPHHGDSNSFDKNILSDKNYFCPISVGTNSYGHPSKKIIHGIISQDSYPILVNEDLSSGFVEYIDNDDYIKDIQNKPIKIEY